MKKWLSLLFAISLAFFLAACGTGGDDESANQSGEGNEETTEGATEETTTELIVGASNVPHAEILEQVKPLLAEQGIELDIVTFQDYVLPNQALDSEELDANYFQHIPYLETQMKENGYEFTNAGAVHIEPMAIYSKKYSNIDELPEGAHIILSNSVPDHGRVLSILEREGLITIKEGVEKSEATLEDIAENPKNVQFDTEYEPALLPQIFNNDEGDLVAINSNYALDAGLNPVEDSIAIEDKDSPYVNVIAVRSGDEEREEIKALVEALQSETIKTYINEQYSGAVVPAF